MRSRKNCGLIRANVLALCMLIVAGGLPGLANASFAMTEGKANASLAAAAVPSGTANTWRTIGDYTYYFGSDGKAYTGIKNIAGQFYLFDNEGRLDESAGHITGKISGAGAALGQTSVLIYNSRGEYTCGIINISPDGTYDIGGLAANRYQDGSVQFDKYNVWFNMSAGFYLYNESYVETHIVNVPVFAARTTAGANVIIDSLAERSATVAGRVVDAAGNPIAGINVNCYGSASQVATDSSGNYQLTIPAESMDADANYSTTLYFIDPLNRYNTAYRSVSGRANETKTLSDMKLTSRVIAAFSAFAANEAAYTGSVKGNIKDADAGELIADAGYVYAYSTPDGEIYTGAVIEDGFYEITGLPTGLYELYVYADGGYKSATIHSVEVVDGSETLLDISLEFAAYRVHGNISNYNDVPLSDFEVRAMEYAADGKGGYAYIDIYPANYPDGDVSYRVLSDDDGNYELNFSFWDTTQPHDFALFFCGENDGKALWTQRNLSFDAAENRVLNVKFAASEIGELPNAPEGWVYQAGIWYYYKEGDRIIDRWVKLAGPPDSGQGEKWRYFNGYGELAGGWTDIERGGRTDTYYFWWNGYGASKAVGIQKLTPQTGGETRTYYFDSDGKMQTAWKYVQGSWRYFDDEFGYAPVAWTQIERGNDIYTYYFWSKADGTYATGLTKGLTAPDGTKNQTYYFDTSGHMQTGFKYVKNAWRYFDDETGAAPIGWRSISRNGEFHTYYFWSIGDGSYAKNWKGKLIGVDGIERVYSFDSSGRLQGEL